jgi:antitoxin HicB
MENLEYPFRIQPLSEAEGGGYLIEFPDLPGCISDGATVQEAIHNGADAMGCWIEAMREAGRPVPDPSSAATGKYTINVPEQLYEELAQEAARQGLSVDTIAIVALTRGWTRLLERIPSGPVPMEISATSR